MSDAERRQLERAAAAGDGHARVRLLQERLRSGELERERLALAAYLGDPDAVAACDEPFSSSSLVGWILGLDRWGAVVCVRASLAAARSILEALSGDDPEPTLPLSRAEDWIECPCHEHAEEAGRAADMTAMAWANAVQASQMNPAASWSPAALAVWEAAMGTARAASVDEAVSSAAEACQAAARVSGEESLRAAVRSALVPWALGA